MLPLSGVATGAPGILLADTAVVSVASCRGARCSWQLPEIPAQVRDPRFWALLALCVAAVVVWVIAVDLWAVYVTADGQRDT
jgi:hypothetical protein